MTSDERTLFLPANAPHLAGREFYVDCVSPAAVCDVYGCVLMITVSEFLSSRAVHELAKCVHALTSNLANVQRHRIPAVHWVCVLYGRSHKAYLPA